MKKWNTPLVLLLMVLVVGCSTIITDVNYDYDRSVDFTGLKSYAWEPFQSNPRIDKLTLKRVKRIVDEQLETKGYSAISANPDFLIAITGRKDTKADHWSDGDRFTYEEGTLVIEFLDLKSKEHIWRGNVSADTATDFSIYGGEALIMKRAPKNTSAILPALLSCVHSRRRVCIHAGSACGFS